MITREEIISERLEGPVGKIEYIKYKGVKIHKQGWRLYLRCIQETVDLCDKCDDYLESNFKTSRSFILDGYNNKPSVILESIKDERVTLIIHPFFTPNMINNNTPFYLCMECSKKIHTSLQNSIKWKLGNKDYEPLVELSQYDETDYDDDAWVDVACRPATAEEISRLE